jgi:predicted dehydrogenase
MPEKYRVGVIGRTGRGDYGHGLDIVWNDVPGTKVVAVADDDKQGLTSAAKRLQVEKAFLDYRQMLDEVRPDIVAIAPRWVDQRRDMAVAAAERGIHVFVEKPLCRTLSEADDIVAACERTHVKFVIAHQTRYSPKIEVVRELIAAGRIGRILEYRGRGKEDHRGGGEDLFVLGTHIMDLIRIFAGTPLWCFASVLENGQPIRRSDVKEGPEGLGPLAGDAVRAVYGMPDRALATFDSYRNAGHGARFSLVIYGTNGIIEMQTGFLPATKLLVDPKWSPGRSGAKWQDISSAGLDLPEPIMAENDLHAGNVAAAHDLVAAIGDNRETKGNVYEARGALEMIFSVFESQRVRGPVDLPLKNRQHPLTMLVG